MLRFLWVKIDLTREVKKISGFFIQLGKMMRYLACAFDHKMAKCSFKKMEKNR